MKIVKIIKKVAKKPNTIFLYLTNSKLLDWLSDEKYLKCRYYGYTGKKLNLKEPKSFNEKIQWLKLNDKRPEYSMMVDKYEVKDYVASKIGEEHIIPTLGVWDRFEDIDFDTLPEQFVLKCTHDSGGLIICDDKNKLDYEKARKKINACLKNNFFRVGREWPYKNVKPRIIAEKYMVDETGTELKDYKIFCFNGEPKYIQVDYGRFKEHKRNIYTLDWKYIDMSIKFPTDASVIIERPYNLEKMIELAKVLSKDIPHVRVDFYSIEEEIFFGELTFYHGSGFEKFTPEKWEYKFGDCIQLRK